MQQQHVLVSSFPAIAEHTHESGIGFNYGAQKSSYKANALTCFCSVQVTLNSNAGRIVQRLAAWTLYLTS